MATSNRLFVQVFWGRTGTFIQSFAPEDGPIHGQAGDEAAVPLWGIPSAEGGFTLAEPTAQGYRIHVPPGARVERSKQGDAYARSSIGDATLELAPGDRARITVGETVIALSLEAAPAPISKHYRRAFLPILVLLVTFVFPVYFLLAYHSQKDSRRTAAKELWWAAQSGMPELIRPGDPISAADASSEQVSNTPP